MEIVYRSNTNVMKYNFTKNILVEVIEKIFNLYFNKV